MYPYDGTYVISYHQISLEIVGKVTQSDLISFPTRIGKAEKYLLAKFSIFYVFVIFVLFYFKYKV